MVRGSVEILDDDEEADVTANMLEACGLDSDDFYSNEGILTKENFEKNLDVLAKMAEVRQPEDLQEVHGFNRASFFVLGYFALLTGARIPESLRKGILEATKWEYEEGKWGDEGFALKRKVFIEDFREKIRILKPGKRLHTASVSFSSQDLLDSKVVLGINEFRDFSDYGKIDGIKYLNLDGWGLESVPQEVFEFRNLKSLSLKFNQITEIPNEVSYLASMKVLNVGFNRLTSLPESIGEIKFLKSLSVVNNNISSLPKSIQNLRNLKYIGVGGTKITRAPEFLKDARFDKYTHTIYPNLTKYWISKN